MDTPDFVQSPQVRRQRAALGFGGLPVPWAVLVFLGVEVFLATGPDRQTLEQLVSGVDPPRRRARHGERGAQPERRGTAVLQERVQDVGRVDEEVRAQE